MIDSKYTEDEIKKISTEFFCKTSEFFIACKYKCNEYDKFIFDLAEYVKSTNRNKLIEARYILNELQIDYLLFINSINENFDKSLGLIFESNIKIILSNDNNTITQIINYRLLIIEIVNNLLESKQIKQSFLNRILKFIGIKK